MTIKRRKGKRVQLAKAIAEQLTEQFGNIDNMREQLYCKQSTCIEWLQGGGLLVYYYDVFDFYANCGYKVENYTESEIWEKYKLDVSRVMIYNLNHKENSDNTIVPYFY